MLHRVSDLKIHKFYPVNLSNQDKFTGFFKKNKGVQVNATQGIRFQRLVHSCNFYPVNFPKSDKFTGYFRKNKGA